MSGHLIGCVKNLEAKAYELPASNGSTRQVHIGKSHKLAMVAFADSADDQTHIGFAGYKGVQKWAACSRSRAAELINDLVDVGLLQPHRKARPGKNAEYVVFPGGCCELHRKPDTDTRDDTARSVAQLLLDLEAAGMPLTDAQRALLDGIAQNGSEISDASPRNESETSDPSQGESPDGSEISDASGQRVQNGSEISEYSTTTTTPPSPRQRGATAATATPAASPALPPALPPASCPRHPAGVVDNCRGCGTTPRQIAARRRRERADATRAAEAARFAAEGGALRRAPTAADTKDPTVRAHLAEARAQIRRSVS